MIIAIKADRTNLCEKVRISVFQDELATAQHFLRRTLDKVVEAGGQIPTSNAHEFSLGAKRYFLNPFVASTVRQNPELFCQGQEGFLGWRAAGSSAIDVTVFGIVTNHSNLNKRSWKISKKIRYDWFRGIVDFFIKLIYICFEIKFEISVSLTWRRLHHPDLF